jgi:hypothetical protein
MENWEFLIQKQGDHSWNQYKTDNLDLEEGKYRLIFHSQYANLNLEILVIYQEIESGQLIRCVQKRSRQTNHEGLVVIFPFTYLKPGLWEINCISKGSIEMEIAPWQHTINLQILPRLSDRMPSSIDNEPLIPDRLKQFNVELFESEVEEERLPSVANLERSLQELENLLQQQIEPMLHKIDAYSNVFSKENLSSKSDIIKDQEEIEEELLSTSREKEPNNIETIKNTKLANLKFFDPKQPQHKISTEIKPLSGLVLPPKFTKSSFAENKKKGPLLPDLKESCLSTRKLLVTHSNLELENKDGKSELIQQDFSSLKLDDRFWSKMNSLVNNNED